MTENATDLIRNLIKVLVTDYGVSNADAQDLLDRIVTWAREQQAKQTRKMFRVVDGGKAKP